MEKEELNNKKLVQLIFVEPKGVICEYEVNDKEDEGKDFMIPSHIIVGLFNDGTFKAAGIHGIDTINLSMDTDDLFLYDGVCDIVYIKQAKQYVRGRMANYDFKESTAKINILQDLTKAGIEISDVARDYLLSV